MGEGSVLVLETQNPAPAAVRREALPAEVAGPAAQVDFSHHPLAQPGRPVRAGHHPYELVPRHPAKAVVAQENLPVAAAHPGQPHPNQDLPGAGCGGGQLFQGQ
ncbi:MAG: hypothetical protein ABSC45_08900 [Desulfobaccales bacterium]